MGYHVYLFRKEVKEQNDTLDFLENEELITKFTPKQFESLKKRLLIYKFEIESQTQNNLTFNFQGGLYGISVLLTQSGVYFSSDFSEDGMIEISMAASEFTDTGEFSRLDPGEGTWEKM